MSKVAGAGQRQCDLGEKAVGSDRAARVRIQWKELQNCASAEILASSVGSRLGWPIGGLQLVAVGLG